ncbi:molybdopterin-dependent oxidoreductase [Shimia sp. R9_2]|uniref:molybdopterin-dependent oxidoreductase n=1 Tax=Shimia sp. R9_2 TaxID=2821112 RepID=UPI001FFE0DB5|nr:molybdopterin-dependent oxidoreductase [Shimia sp. R9_2]
MLTCTIESKQLTLTSSKRGGRKMRPKTSATFALALSFLLPLTTALRAADAMDTPSGSVILTVSGTIDKTNVDDTAQFDLEMLRELPAASISTSTIWTEGVLMFTGVPIALLLEELGNSGNTLRASAINDYTIEIPVASLEGDAPILAYEMNGDTMHRREKGPLWVIYPFDSDEKYRTSQIYSRSIWQLDRIEVID